LEIGIGSEAGEVVVVVVVVVVVDSILESADISGEPPGDASSGFAMRRPPKDWERLKSPSIASTASKNVAEAS